MATDKPVILVLTEDLFIVPRLEDAARDLGYRLQVADSPAAFGAEGAPAQRAVPLTEPLEGPDAHFMRSLVDLRPSLMLVDTTCQNIPWERWIQVVKTAAASRRIPIVAFGPHVDERALQRAAAAGAELTVTRGQLQSSLPSIVRDNARTIDPEALRLACDGELSAKAAHGLRLLNDGEYYEAHELLEHAWMEAEQLEGYLYRSLLQIAVAYLQVERDNHPGAVKMLLRLRQWLAPLPDRCRGIDVAQLKENVQQFGAALEAAGPSGLSDLELRPVPLDRT